MERDVRIKFRTPRGTKRELGLEVSLEFGLNLSATGSIEPAVARMIAHALLYHADVLDLARASAARSPDRIPTGVPEFDAAMERGIPPGQLLK